MGLHAKIKIHVLKIKFSFIIYILMLPCQMILFPRKNYNINNLNNTVLVNNTQYNQTPTIKLTNQKDKYIQEKASP